MSIRKKIALFTLLFVMIATMLAGTILVACDNTNNNNNENGDDDTKGYSIYVKSMGGLGLAGVSVTAKSSGKEIAKGSTDTDGKFYFEADSGVYDITVTDLPIGYTLDANNSYKTSADKKKLLILATSAVIKQAIPSNKVYKVGDVAFDFSFTDQSDRNNDVTYTLSEVLETKKMVLLNFWSTNCGPCMSEMPALELAYREYKEDAEVFALNVPLLGSQTLNDIRTTRNTQYTDEDGNNFSLTFPMAIDNNEMPLHFNFNAIPVSVVIDRYGVVADIHVGSMDKSSFVKLFAKYTSDDYVQDQVIGGDDNPDDELVREKPDVTMPDSKVVEAAINGANFNGKYYPETGTEDAEYSWPWLVGETNGEKYIYPSNHEVNYSFATIYTSVTISSEDVQSSNGEVVLAFDLQWSCENMGDYFYVIVNNSIVYEFTGTEQWGKWQDCYAIVANEPGDYTVVLMYVKDQQLSEGFDTVRIKNMRLISIGEIAIPSLDMPRDAATHWNGTTYNDYVTAVLGDDGYYHKDTKDGPYIVADLKGVTAFNTRIGINFTISEFAVNGYFDYNKVDVDDPSYKAELDDTEAITKWAMVATNSDLYGLTVVTDELVQLLNTFIKSQVGASKFNNNMWLEFCRYFDHYGTDPDDHGICDMDHNPIRGLLNETALPTVGAYQGELDLDNIPDEYKNLVVESRLIVPRGIKYLFVPDKSGVYRFRTQSAYLNDTMGWLYSYAGDELVSTDSQLENPDQEYNMVLTYYLEAGQKYVFATCHTDVGGTGEYTFTVEYLGEEAYVWQYAATNFFLGGDEEMSYVKNNLNVMPVLYQGYYYNAKKDANGNYIKGADGNYVANTDDPIYVDFMTGARFFDNGSLDRCFVYGEADAIRKTVSGILARMWGKTAPTNGWTAAVPLATIKGSALTSDDWENLIVYLYGIYGDNVYIDTEEMYRLLTICNNVGGVVSYLQKYYLSFFNQTYWRYDDSLGIDESRYKDYTDVVNKYYKQALAYNGDPARGYADTGCVKVTEELAEALNMFAKRMGGFPELETDWLRLCAHFEYMGSAK